MIDLCGLCNDPLPLDHKTPCAECRRKIRLALTPLPPRVQRATQITSPSAFRVRGDTDGVWLELPDGRTVWLPPDYAHLMATALEVAAGECVETRAVTR